MDRFFGNVKPGLDQAKDNGKMSRRKQVQGHCYKKFKRWNEFPGNFEGKYRFLSVKIPVQSERIFLLDLKSSIQSSLAFRVTFNVDTGVWKTLTNYGAPWFDSPNRHEFRGQLLNNLLVEKKRTHFKRTRSLNAISLGKSKKPETLCRNRRIQYTKKKTWKQTFRDQLYFPSFLNDHITMT